MVMLARCVRYFCERMHTCRVGETIAGVSQYTPVWARLTHSSASSPRPALGRDGWLVKLVERPALALDGERCTVHAHLVTPFTHLFASAHTSRSALDISAISLDLF